MRNALFTDCLQRTRCFASSHCFLAHHFLCINKDKNEEHNHWTPTMIYRFATLPHILVVKTSPGAIYARDMTPQARMTLSV